MGHNARSQKRAKDYLKFTKMQRPKGWKTDIWRISNRHTGDAIGRVFFYPQWRQYVSTATTGTVWSSECHTVIAGFLKDQNVHWRYALREKEES